jgi:ATP-dependent Clp protease ATP-binding subunit ClpC
MDFLAWHYTRGTRFYLKRYLFALAWVGHYFSLPLLVCTLFSPWKRLVEKKTGSGFNAADYFRRVSFNFISRAMGAVVRMALLLAGLVTLVVVMISGILGLGVWLVLPVLSLGIYLTGKKLPSEVVGRMKAAIDENPAGALKIVFESEAGEFVLRHTGLVLSEVLASAKKTEFGFGDFEPASYGQLMTWLVGMGVWDEGFFNSRNISSNDLVDAALWWDSKRGEEAKVEDYPSLGRPGVGLELLYGYTPTLDKYSVDLSTPQPFSHHLIGRQNVVSRMERVLTSGNSVVLMGQPGVGKKTVVLEFARRARSGQLGEKMAYKRILELDFNFVFSESGDLNKKKAQLAVILGEAASAGNVILVVRDLHRITHPDIEGLDFTDVLEGFLEARELKIIAISTSVEYERFISPNMRLRKFFETVEVTQPSKEEAMEILLSAADWWERMKALTITVPALRKILDESDRYITETPFPEKALEILDASVVYEEQKGEDGVVGVNDVAGILTEKTGIPFGVISEVDKEKLVNLEEIIHGRLVDQETAVGLISQILRSKSMGVVNSARPLGSFLFLGPTGVGKTETAKVLANVYYGSSENILRFDMAEYAGGEGIERLIGSLAGGAPGVLTTGIKNRPASLLLLDEIEKATPQVFNLFLSLLDEGVITDALERKINCRNLFVIATSNAGAEQIRRLVSGGVRGESLQREVLDYVLREGIFSPEFINRFDGTVVYEPLGKEELVEVARLMFGDLADNMKKKNINLEFSGEAVEGLVTEGFDPVFGARPMRRLVEIKLGDMIGKALLAGELKSGDRIRIERGKDNKGFSWRKMT